MSGSRGSSAVIVAAMLAVGLMSSLNLTAPVIADDSSVATGSLPVQTTKTGDGFFRVALQDDMKTTNTLIARDIWDWEVLECVMDSPVIHGKITRKEMPWLAESWEYDTADPLNATMTLRKGIYWTDHNFGIYGDGYPATGYVPALDSVPAEDDPYRFREVTAYDIVFTINLVKDAPRYQSGLDCLRIDTKNNSDPSDDIMGVEVVDRYTVKYTLATPRFDFVDGILGFPVWPEHIWKPHLADKFTWQPEVDEAVYCGMFILDSWDKGNMVKLVTNEHYWNKSAIPNIDGIIFKIYGTTDLAVLALTKGEVDLIDWPITPGYIPIIQWDNELALAQTMESGFFYLAFNMRNRAFGYDRFTDLNKMDVGKPLRLAISHCINKEMIVLKLLQGKGTVGDSAVSPANAAYYNSTVDKYAFDPARAIQILDTAGYYKVSGWYVAPDGSPIDGPGGDGEIEIIHPPADYDPVRAEAGRDIAEQLEAIGIKAVSKPIDYCLPWPSYDTTDFEVQLLGWEIGDQYAQYMRALYRTDEADTINGYNIMGYRNASYDAIVDRMVQETDIDENIRLNKQAQGIIARDVPVNVLYYRDRIEAYSIAVFKHGWWEGSGGLFNRWTLMDLSIAQSQPLNVRVFGPEKLNAPATYSVKVTNAVTGTAIQGASVDISQLYDRGSVAPTTGTTNEYGTFSFQFTPDIVTVDTAETFVAWVAYNYTDKAGSLSVLIKAPEEFWLVTSSEITEPMPAYLDEASALGIPFEVRVEDQADGFVFGAMVEVAAAPSGGIFNDDTNTTSESGIAEFVFYPPANQSASVTYTMIAYISYHRPEDNRTYTQREDLEAEVLVINQLLVKVTVSDISFEAGEEIRVAVSIANPYESVSGRNVTLTASPSTAIITPETATTDAQGKAEFVFEAEEPGPYMLTAVYSSHWQNHTARVAVTVLETEAPPDETWYDEIPLAVWIAASIVLVALMASVALFLASKRK